MITKETLTVFANNYNSDPHKKAMSHVFSRTELDQLAFAPERQKDLNRNFSLDLPVLKATNQKNSGRCWMFASMNLFRQKLAKEKKLEDFEFSESFIAFWDKFEKVNFFFEQTIAWKSKHLSDREMQQSLDDGIQDGGDWTLFVNIVEKYGIVPKSVMPETAQSSNTTRMNELLNRFMRKTALQLRSTNKPEEVRLSAMQQVYNFLCECYGAPVERFDFEYTDTDKVYHVEENYTPETFRDTYLGNFAEDFVCLVHLPDRAYDKMYQAYYANTVEGSPQTYLNVELPYLKQAVLAQMNDLEPVVFACDATFFGDRKEKQLWDDQSYDYDLLTGFDTKMTKAERLQARESKMNHMMLFTGVNLVNGTPNRWKIENSWGTEGDGQGFYVASDSWFDLQVYEVVVRKQYIADKQDLLEQEPIWVEPWDCLSQLKD